VISRDFAGRAVLSVSAALWWASRVGASVLLGLRCVHLALVCWPREYAPGLSRLVRLRPRAAEACAAVPRLVSGLLLGLRWAIALTLPSLPERVLFGLAGMRRRCAAVSEWVGEMLVRVLLAVDRGAGILQRARGTETGVHC
jgi:hypothetical protein